MLFKFLKNPKADFWTVIHFSMFLFHKITPQHTYNTSDFMKSLIWVLKRLPSLAPGKGSAFLFRKKKNSRTKRTTMTHMCWGNCLMDGVPLSWIQPKPPLQLYNGAFWKCLNSHRVAKLANKVGAGWQIYWLGHRPK